MKCLSCGSCDLQVQVGAAKKNLFCPGCGWTGNVLDIFSKIQKDIDFVFEKIGVKNDEKNIHNSDSIHN